MPLWLHCYIQRRFLFSLESLDHLTNLVIKLFSEAKDKSVPIPKFPVHPYGEEQLQVRKMSGRKEMSSIATVNAQEGANLRTVSNDSDNEIIVLEYNRLAHNLDWTCTIQTKFCRQYLIFIYLFI